MVCEVLEAIMLGYAESNRSYISPQCVPLDVSFHLLRHLSCAWHQHAVEKVSERFTHLYSIELKSFKKVGVKFYYIFP